MNDCIRNTSWKIPLPDSLGDQVLEFAHAHVAGPFMGHSCCGKLSRSILQA